jgi:hypothetical protein
VRCVPEAWRRQLQAWITRYKLTRLVALRLEGRELTLVTDDAAIAQAKALAGCVRHDGHGPARHHAPGCGGVISRLCLLHYPVNPQTTVTRWPKPDERQRAILDALGVRFRKMQAGAVVASNPVTNGSRMTSSGHSTRRLGEDPAGAPFNERTQPSPSEQ